MNMKAFRGSRGNSDAAQFERLYRENYEYVYNYVSFRMAGSQDAEDIVSEAFLKAARSFNAFDPNRARFSTWVVSIARNCLVDYWRKQRSNAPIEEVPDTVIAVEDDYAGLNEDAALARKLLAGLDESDRELVFLKYYKGMKNVDIAQELGMNASTVATRLQRALARMRATAEGDAR